MAITTLQYPKRMVYGIGSLEALNEITAKRVAIITDTPVMTKIGIIPKLVEQFSKIDVKAEVLGDIQREPSFQLINKNLEAIRQFIPDTLVALGGGSVIDAAKTVKILLNYPDVNPKDIPIHLKSLKPTRTIKTLVAIPSTSGTGSEVTPYAVLTDDNTRMKQVLVHNELMPDLAILDPEIPFSMPPKVTADTGFDALSHAIESYVCTTANEFTRPYALEASKLLLENLERCYAHGSDLPAREKVHYAATLAGIAIANSSAGLAHRMDQIGPRFNLSHGRVLGVLMPYVMQYNAKVSKDKYAEISLYLGYRDKSPERLCGILISTITSLGNSLGIPSNLRDAGVRENQFLRIVDELAHEAVEGLSAKTNPRKLTPNAVKKVFTHAYHGKPVDF